jgi:Zn-finger nucleic acid-binding protein
MDHTCPDCGSALNPVDAGAGHTLVCRSCRGRVVGLSPFERLVGTSTGALVWRAAADGAPGGNCPYCSRPMHRPDGGGSNGDGGLGAAGAGITVCRLCREVWLPAGSSDWMDAHGAGAHSFDAGPGGGASGECDNCGAPWQPDEDGRCRFCHTQLTAPAPMVMIVNTPATPASRWDSGFRLF